MSQYRRRCVPVARALLAAALAACAGEGSPPMPEPQWAPPETARADAPADAAYPFALQLGSLPSRGQAIGEWERLQVLHPELLSGRELVLSTQRYADGRVRYRLQTGRFRVRDAAQRACAGFWRVGEPCMVVIRR